MWMIECNPFLHCNKANWLELAFIFTWYTNRRCKSLKIVHLKYGRSNIVTYIHPINIDQFQLFRILFLLISGANFTFFYKLLCQLYSSEARSHCPKNVFGSSCLDFFHDAQTVNYAHSKSRLKNDDKAKQCSRLYPH